MEKRLIIISEYTDTLLTIEEICDICRVSPDFIHDLVDYEIIHPKRSETNILLFNLEQFERIKQVLRLRHDLEINLAGISIILDLLDEVQNLRGKIELLEKHLLK